MDDWWLRTCLNHDRGWLSCDRVRVARTDRRTLHTILPVVAASDRHGTFFDDLGGG